MTDRIRVCAENEVPQGSMKTFTVQGKPVAIANVDGEFFAVGDTCTHEQCSLGTEGALDGNIIICGCHGGMFDVTTGAVVAPPPPGPVTSYATERENGAIYIKV